MWESATTNEKLKKALGCLTRHKFRMPRRFRVSIQNAEEINFIYDEVEVVFQSGPYLGHDPHQCNSVDFRFSLLVLQASAETKRITRKI